MVDSTRSLQDDLILVTDHRFNTVTHLVSHTVHFLYTPTIGLIYQRRPSWTGTQLSTMIGRGTFVDGRQHIRHELNINQFLINLMIFILSIMWQVSPSPSVVEWLELVMLIHMPQRTGDSRFERCFNLVSYRWILG